MDEATPLLPSSSSSAVHKSSRERLYDFLEAKTRGGRLYERFIIILIAVNVLAFILASLFVEEYNPVPWASRKHGICRNACDALFFGNYPNNGLQWMQIGSTSILELVTVAVFSVEYVLRLYTADLESPKYAGFVGRLRFVPTFFSLVDLASTLPFFIDAFVLRHSDIAASSFLRMFRLLRMMRVEGRYDTALTMVDDVYQAQKGVLGTALFIGLTTWISVSSLYYLTERRNLDMVYCGAASDCDDVDTSQCEIDKWGITNCTQAGCPSTDDNPEPCYNLFSSIPMASYYALLNLFGEFPLIGQHSALGQIVATLTAIVAVAVFALPVGIIGNGFEDVIAQRRNEEHVAKNDKPIVERGGLTSGFLANEDTFKGRLYNLFHIPDSSRAAIVLEYIVNTLIILTALSFMIDTLSPEVISTQWHVMSDIFEFASVVIFTLEYVLRVYSAHEDPKFNKPGGRLQYMCSFLPLVDLLSFLPYWIDIGSTGRIITPIGKSSTGSNVVKGLRLLRILRFERYTHAFTSFDDVVTRNIDILAVTAFTALLFWVFFGAFLYFSERDNPDDEMSSNYNTVPNSMWVTLLNLSGESPLSQYTMAGKVVTGIVGLFATGVFGIPIGVLGAGFEEVVEAENEENTEELQQTAASRRLNDETLGTSSELAAYNFVNGIGSNVATYFELSIYFFIFATISVGIWQTVEGQENTLHQVEWIAVFVFTFEYLLRFYGAGADPEFARDENGFMSRLRYVFSFYSIIDLLAIVPMYLARALPNSIVNEYDEYLRMLRILRLVKLDKYVPSITLIDDVIRLKLKPLSVALFAALTLWILFAASLYVAEYKDRWDGIDPVPLYGCADQCSMADRFQTFFDSMVYTGIHLTGDYPIITYSWPARFINVFMIIAAVGVVSIPSGLIASGFVQVVQSKNRAKQGRDVMQDNGRAGDDWYEVSYRELDGTSPPPSKFGPTIDRWQVAVNEFLNGRQRPDGTTEWPSTFAFASRIFIFAVIISNVLAVLVESIPQIDKAVGNQKGNFFDVFEAFSVGVFALEYILRLFCAPKNREALYSSYIYATTFFGIVDFLSTAPWFIEKALVAFNIIDNSGDISKIFRIFRIFRILQLEDFIVAFSKLDNVFRASKDVLKATGLLAIIIWVGCGALFYLFEENNPNWRECGDSIPLRNYNATNPGCFDFESTAACNEFYPGMCQQKAFNNMPNSLYYTAIFLAGEWGVVDLTWPGRMVCLFLCIVGIALYAIPVGTLFDSFGAVLGMGGDDEEEATEENSDENNTATGDENDSETANGLVLL